MSIESLKRVLLRVKATARGMRKGDLENRLKPKAKAKPEDEKLVEGSEAEEAAETPDEEATELGGEKKPKDKKEDPAVTRIRNLLSRS